MKNKILVVFLGIIVVVFSAFVASVKALNTSVFVDEVYLENNWNRILLAEKVHSRITNYYNIEDYYKDTYPSYFGGMYISNDATKLIIQIVKSNIPANGTDEYSIYNEIVNMDNSIQIEYVDNSYNELNEVNNDVSDYMSSNKLKDKNVSGTYIDIMSNEVVVELADNSEVKQQSFKKDILEFLTTEKTKKSLKSEMIKFNKGKYKTHAYINVGGQITVSGGYCSMAFRVNYNGKNGYLTAGHCTTAVGATIASGTVRARQLANNQNFDYAFIETNSSYVPTNNLAYTTTGITKLGLITYCPFLTVNMAVAKAGRTTGYTSGKITGLNASVYYSDINMTIKSMVKTNVYSAPGDSGGAFIIPRTDANGGAIGLGILSGGDSTTTYFSDLNVLPIALQNRY